MTQIFKLNPKFNTLTLGERTKNNNIEKSKQNEITNSTELVSY